MRRLLIQYCFPFFLCLIPFLAAFLVALAVPEPAMNYYVQRLQTSKLDWVILGMGIPLFFLQVLLTWRALRWTGAGFDESKDRWINTLAQAAEWFPLLGLIGTAMGILETFSGIASATHNPGQREIIDSYAPAITTTASGLFMAFINILPSWIIMLGRDLIVSLGSGGRSSSRDVQP